MEHWIEDWIWGKHKMRWINLLFLSLFSAIAFAGTGTSLHAAADEKDVAAFCYEQGQICTKICDLNSRFEDRFDGCRHSCESRAFRCTRTACFRWPERQFLIAERFGGYRCAQ